MCAIARKDNNEITVLVCILCECIVINKLLTSY